LEFIAGEVVNDEQNEQPAGPSGSGDQLDREIHEALGGKSIEDLLDETESLPRQRSRRRQREISVGAIVPCKVVTIDDRQSVLMQMGPKDQGYVSLTQFDKAPEAGEIFQLEVVRYDDDEDMWVLSREGAVERATWEDLRVGQIVEGMVEKCNKGGLEVRFSSIKAFMPLSQISMYRVEHPEEYVNQKIRCQVVEVDRRENRIIVSARALMEVEAAKRREELMATVTEGDVMEGVVRQIMPYGAFVDLGGVDGLVHVSQMSYSRGVKPEDVVSIGQTVTVTILKIDEETGKLSLGMKQTMADPWAEVESKYPPGFLATGKIVKLEGFGAFVELEPGLEALIPISELTWKGRVHHPSDVVQAGQEVQAVVLQVEADRRRISLSLKQAQANPWAGAAQRLGADMEVAGKVTRIADFGAFVEVEPGVEGLVHISELSNEHVRAVRDVVKEGDSLNVRILSVDEDARRISLTAKSGSSGGGHVSAFADKPKKNRKKPLNGGLD